MRTETPPAPSAGTVEETRTVLEATLPPAVGGGGGAPSPAAGPAPAVRRSVADHARSWFVRHRRSLPALTALLALTAVVRAVNLGGYPAPVDDEGTYMAEAWSVQVHHALTPYTYWYDHPPLGWIQIAGWTWLTDGFRASALAVDSGRSLMVLLSVVTGALVFVVARRLGCARVWAAVAVGLLALSPLALTYQRMVYLDNLAVPWLLAAFALALSPARKLWAFAASGACLAVAVLSKETVLIFAPALVWQAWQRSDRSTRAFCVTAQLAVFAVILSLYPLLALLKGELVPGPGHVSLLGAVGFQLSGRQSSGSPFDPASASHALVAGWLGLDAWLPAAAVAGLAVTLWARRLRPVGVALLIGLVTVLRGGYLPVPYVVTVLPFCALVVAGAADVLWRGARPGRRPSRRLPRLAARALLVAGAAVLVAGASPAWAAGLGTAFTAHDDRPLQQSESWVEHHVGHRQRLLVDDTMWVDLTDHGFDSPLGVVWFYKLGYVNNLDPSVARRLPGGWRDFDYVIDTPSMRGALSAADGQLRQVTQALDHSVTVAAFGRGDQRIMIRRIEVPMPRRGAPATHPRPPDHRPAPTAKEER